jgi:DNA-binding response OmpR family regulator
MNLLLIENNPEFSSIFEPYFHEYGHTVMTFFSAEDAVTAAAAWRPDAVLIGCPHPGLRLAMSRIKSEPSLGTLPIIVLSCDPEDRTEGASAFIDKSDLLPEIEKQILKAAGADA